MTPTATDTVDFHNAHERYERAHAAFFDQGSQDITDGVGDEFSNAQDEFLSTPAPTIAAAVLKLQALIEAVEEALEGGEFLDRRDVDWLEQLRADTVLLAEGARC